MDGKCARPFDYLGLHAAPGGRGLELRAWQPDVEQLEALDARTGRSLGQLKRQGGTDLFLLSLPKRRMPLAYRLRKTCRGAVSECYDPYQFAQTTLQSGISDSRRLYRSLGAHLTACELGSAGQVSGVRFCVYAPAARSVSVVGDFNSWDGRRTPMASGDDGVWRMFVPEIGPGSLYKFEVRGPDGRLRPTKSDPFGLYQEQPPNHASIVYDAAAYQWGDAQWLKARAGLNLQHEPMSVYEVHLGSWQRPTEGVISYRYLARTLIPYVQDRGFTHIELLPIQEHPFTGSWGYQPVGLFAPTSRFGPPEDLKLFIDSCHQAGIGVILDWVPAHFPNDPHGLSQFDGTALYEHPDPRRGWHPDWGTHIYDYGREHVRDFLVSNALYWLDHYHVDGLRVDAVASMLYLDYSREAGEWTPNIHGGNENLEAVRFLKMLNEAVHGEYPGSVTIAEESTAWPKVSWPTYESGLGFSFKWNMGWMHDTLRYMSNEPVHRKYHHDDLTFSLVYAFSEHFVLPLSHDEVVHGKGSLLNKMPGDEWQRFANLRCYLAYMFAHPGKKLLFMGSELGQWDEWNHDGQLRWDLLEQPLHRGLSDLVRELNRLYRAHPALYQQDESQAGFQWIDHRDVDNSVLAFVRRGTQPEDMMVVVCNFTPVVREAYRIGVPLEGTYREILNTDAQHLGGGNVGNLGQTLAQSVACHGQPCSIPLTLPPLATLYLQPVGADR